MYTNKCLNFVQALLCRIASTSIGAELLLEQNCLVCLSAMQVFDDHPDTTPLVGCVICIYI